ncbi:MAG: hypothetical protein ICV87_02545 [Gemmatimonadetes bacterium]|nr:hypothetical protein [Gemmatimonadota bacterium]
MGLKEGHQKAGGIDTGMTPKGTHDDKPHTPNTAGTNHDADTSGESKNQGHSHPRRSGAD